MQMALKFWIPVSFFAVGLWIFPGQAMGQATGVDVSAPQPADGEGKTSSGAKGILNTLFPRAGGTAEQTDYKAYTLGEIVVSETPKDSGYAITNEVTAEDIRATDSKTAAEALRYVPGVDVSIGYKNEPDVSIHGLDQEKILVLIDGVPYYETNYGKLNLNQIPTEIIAKIQVIKGAPSVLYGPNAEAGVINIITKEPGKPFTASTNVELGEKDYNRVSASTGAEAGAFKYWFNYTHSEIDAWRMSDNYKPTEGVIIKKPGGKRGAVIDDGGFRSNSSSKTDSFWAKAGIAPGNDSEYYANFHWIMSQWDIPPSVSDVTVFPDKPAFSRFARFDKYNDWGIDLNAKQRALERLLLKNNAYFHSHEDAYVSYGDENFAQKLARSAYKDWMAGDSLFADYDLAKWDTVRLAFHYRVDSHRERDDSYLPYSESLSNTGSVAAENEFRLIPNLTATAGMGWDWFNVLKSQANTTDSKGDFSGRINRERPGLKDMLSPMGGLEYKLPDSTRLFTSLARKGRFPTLQQLYSSKGGNPGLEPETSLNYTLGASRSFLNDMVWTEVSYFNHIISDWISRDGPDVTNQYRNYGKVRMNGIELNAEFRPIEELTFKLGYTYNHARDHSKGRVTDYLIDAPANKIDMDIGYTMPWTATKIDLIQQFQSKTYSQLPTPKDPDLEKEVADGFYVFNVKFTQPLTKYLDGYVSLENLWDRNYETIYGFPSRGRTVLFGIDARY
ncbi:MAG: TonB-dependent receptor [bacterium]